MSKVIVGCRIPDRPLPNSDPPPRPDDQRIRLLSSNRDTIQPIYSASPTGSAIRMGRGLRGTVINNSGEDEKRFLQVYIPVQRAARNDFGSLGL
jgi:hypothetical protein